MDDNEFLELFVEEVGEHLASLNRDLLALEEDQGKPETVNSLMRAAHTIKGAAMLMSFEPMAKLAHAMEHRLREEIRLGREVPADLVDLLLAGGKAIQVMIAEARRAGSLEGVARSQEWSDLAARLEAPARAATGNPPDPPGLGSASSLPETPGPHPAAAPTSEEAVPEGPVDRPAHPAPSPIADPQSDLKEHIKISVEKVDQLNDLVGELLIYQARLEAKEGSLREIARRLDGLVSVSERAKLFGLSPLPPAVQEIQEELTTFVEALSADLVELNYLGAEIRSRSLQIRMLPAGTMLQEFRLAVRDLRRRLRKEAELVIEGGEIELDKRLIEELKPALLHIIRNAMDHGIESPEERLAAGKPRSGTLVIAIRVEGARVHISVTDDGRGMDHERILRRAVDQGLLTPESAVTISRDEALYLIMQPGFSTVDTVTDVSGRGVGMDVVRTQVEDLKGSIHIETTVGEGSSILLDLPLALSTAQVLMVEVSGEILAIPIGYVEQTLLLSPGEISREGGRPVFRLRDRTLGLYVLQDFLSGLESRTASTSTAIPIVVLHGRGQRVGFQVGRFLEQAEVVVKTLGTFIESVSFLSGATILGDGKPALILDVPDLLSSLSMRRFQASGMPRSTGDLPGRISPRRGSGVVLVVDDSVTTRALEKGILESQGYQVLTAANGEEAMTVLATEPVDLVLTDVDMPGMNGFQLTQRIRSHARHSALPVVICSSQSRPEDRQKGLDVGAQAYLVKRELDQDHLASLVRRLIR